MIADRKIKVLVVDDSVVVRMLLVHLLNSDPQIEVIGTANNGLEAVQFVTREVPDIILMDIQMPEMDGFSATRKILETHPIPIIICSATGDPQHAETAMQAMEAGAKACVEKPVGMSHANYESSAAYLLQTIKLISNSDL